MVKIENEFLNRRFGMATSITSYSVGFGRFRRKGFMSDYTESATKLKYFLKFRITTNVHKIKN